MAVILTDDVEPNAASDSIAREVGALESDVEHVEEKVEEVKEEIAEIDAKIEAVETQIEWNNQEKSAIWTKMEATDAAMTQMQTTLAEMLTANQEEDDLENEADESELVETDIEPIADEPANEPVAMPKRRNPITMFLFGR